MAAIDFPNSPTNAQTFAAGGRVWTWDAAGSVWRLASLASLSTVYQPLDSDLTAIAALSTQPVGRSLLAAVDAAAIRATTESAPLANPTFTGVPAGPTASANTDTTQLATTAFVTAAVAAGGVVTSVASRTGAVVLARADVGLGSVDNTTDAAKPVSTAQATAIALKADLANPTFTGVPAGPTAPLGVETTQLASTAFVAINSVRPLRQIISALAGQPVQTFVNSVGAVGPSHGLVAVGDLAVTQNGTPNMSVNIAAGRAFISGNSVLAQGAYVFTNDDVRNVVIATADATNGRRDLICAQVRENSVDGSGFNDARFFVVTGTPAATPGDPAIPAGCLVLDRVTVGAGVTSITNANIARVAGVARGSNWNMAWGIIARSTAPASDQGSITTTRTDITGLSVTFTAVADRLYRFSTDVNVRQTGAGVASITLTDGSNNRFNAKDMFLGIDETGHLSFHFLGTLTAGTNTVKTRAETTGGTLTIQNLFARNAQLVVEDVGPA